jgi:hypothetical protein
VEPCLNCLVSPALASEPSEPQPPPKLPKPPKPPPPPQPLNSLKSPPPSHTTATTTTTTTTTTTHPHHHHHHHHRRRHLQQLCLVAMTCLPVCSCYSHCHACLAHLMHTRSHHPTLSKQAGYESGKLITCYDAAVRVGVQDPKCLASGTASPLSMMFRDSIGRFAVTSGPSWPEIQNDDNHQVQYCAYTRLGLNFPRQFIITAKQKVNNPTGQWTGSAAIYHVVPHK